MRKRLSELSWAEAKLLKYTRKEWIEAVNNDTRPSSTLKKIAVAAASIVKTTILRKDRTTDEEYAARLSVCETCVHATHKGGKLYTCGPMIKSLIDSNQKTCGCVLVKKARDKTQTCPYGYWPTIKET